MTQTQYDRVERIRAAVANMQNLERGIHQYVDEARRAGVTWQDIAKALGVSRQSAWERYKR